MKTHTKILFLLAAISVISCKKDKPEISLQEAAKAKLSTTWILAEGSSVTLDGEDVTSDYTAFEITFNPAGTYTTINGPAAFNTSGTWVFNGTSLTSITRDGDVATTLTLTDTTLMLEFTIDESQIGSRTTALTGEYVFNLIKE